MIGPGPGPQPAESEGRVRAQAERAALDRAAAALGYPSWQALIRAHHDAQHATGPEQARELGAVIALAREQARRMSTEPSPASSAGPPLGGPAEDARPPLRAAPIRALLERLAAGHVRDAMASALERISQESPEQAAAALARADEAAHRQVAARRAEIRRHRYEHHRPPPYAASSLTRLLPQQDPQGRGRGWLASGHRTALITGPSGHGKSDLAYAIANTALEGGLWVEAWAVPDLAQALAPPPVHARYDEHRSRRRELLAGWVKDCDLLVLDDLGAEDAGGPAADRWRTRLLDILTHRTTRPGKRTIVTTNGGATADHPTHQDKARVRAEAAAALAHRYGAPTATRLRHDCVGIWVEGRCLRTEAAWDPFR